VSAKRRGNVGWDGVRPHPLYGENGGFTLKAHQMFSFHTTLEEFKKATITGHFEFVFEENAVREITLSS